MRLFYLIFILALLSCSKEIEVEQVDYKRKIVVDGWIENGKNAQVLLTLSSPFLAEYDSASIRATFLNYAKVTLSTGSGDSEVLTLSRRNEFFPPFVYKSIRIKGEVGESYKLEVLYQNKLVEARTTIPQLPDVDGVWSYAVSDTSMIIKAEVQDKSGEPDYYYSQIKIRHLDTRFHPATDPLLNDKLFDGQQFHLQIKRSNQPDPLNIYGINKRYNMLPDEFALTDTVLVKISQVDEEAYRVLNGIYLDHLIQGSPFSFVDQKTSTNINGGIGRWTGLASRDYLVFSLR